MTDKKPVVEMVPISKLQISEFNVRKERDSEKIGELAKSIEQEGILQPLLVRPENSHLGIIIGSRRFTAAKKTNLKQIPVIIKELEEDESRIISLVENLQRNDLEPIETSLGFAKALEQGMKGQELAKRLGIRQQYVSDMVGILPVTGKLVEIGMKVKVHPKDSECEARKAIPLQHTICIAEAFRQPKVKELFGKPTSEESLNKAVEVAQAVVHTNQKIVELVTDVFAQDPEANIEELVRQAELGLLQRGSGRSEYHGGRGSKDIDIAEYERGINEHTARLCRYLSDIDAMPEPTDDVEVDFIKASRDHRKMLISELDPMHSAGIHKRLNYLSALIEETMNEIEKVQNK